MAQLHAKQMPGYHFGLEGEVLRSKRARGIERSSKLPKVTEMQDVNLVGFPVGTE